MLAFSDIIDFLLRLISDETAPRGVRPGPAGVAGSRPASRASPARTSATRACSSPTPARCPPRTTAPGSSYPDGDDPVREIGYTTQHYVADERRPRRQRHDDLSLVPRQTPSSPSTTATRCSSSRSPTTTSRSPTTGQINRAREPGQLTSTDRSRHPTTTSRSTRTTRSTPTTTSGRDPGQRRQRRRRGHRHRRDRRCRLDAELRPPPSRPPSWTRASSTPTLGGLRGRLRARRRRRTGRGTGRRPRRR